MQSNIYRFGDEANLTAPLGGYAVADLNASYTPRDGVMLFAVLNNAFDKRYYTYGSFGPVGMCHGQTCPAASPIPAPPIPGRPSPSTAVYG